MQTTLDVIHAYAEGNFDLVMEKMTLDLKKVENG